MLEKKLQKACRKITKTVFDEVTSFQDAAQEAGVFDESFRIATAHRAMLLLHKHDMDVFLSAEFGDLFGTLDLKSPMSINEWIDIERLEKARDKWKDKESIKKK